MRKSGNWWSRSKPAVLIWAASAIFFLSLLHMAQNNSPQNTSSVSSGIAVINMERRKSLYDKLARDLDEKGPAFLHHGETSQSLSLSDIFTIKDGVVTPVLKTANPAVRANVLYLGTQYSLPISEAVKQIFLPYFDKAIWFQNSSLYHFSMFHASHHMKPVLATEDEIEAEAEAVKGVAVDLCPLTIVLDRVVLTSTGVLLGCWQVTSGTDPTTVRAKLRAALPRAPDKQLYDDAIFHTSLARILGPPTGSSVELHNDSEQLQFFHKLVSLLNDRVRGFKAVISELWYVEEHDLLALALNGKMTIHKFQLGCQRT